MAQVIAVRDLLPVVVCRVQGLPFVVCRRIRRVDQSSVQRKRLTDAEKSRDGHIDVGAAGAERDIVDGQIIAITAGCFIAQAQGNLRGAGIGGKGKAIGVPLSVHRNFTGGANRSAIYFKGHIGFDKYAGAGRIHRNDVDGKLVQGIFTNRHQFPVKKSGLETGIHHHHVSERFRPVVFNINPQTGGKRAPTARIVGDGVGTVAGRRILDVTVTRCNTRIDQHYIGYAETKITVGKYVFAQIARTGADAGRTGRCAGLCQDGYSQPY